MGDAARPGRHPERARKPARGARPRNRHRHSRRLAHRHRCDRLCRIQLGGNAAPPALLHPASGDGAGLSGRRGAAHAEFRRLLRGGGSGRRADLRGGNRAHRPDLSSRRRLRRGGAALGDRRAGRRAAHPLTGDGGARPRRRGLLGVALDIRQRHRAALARPRADRDRGGHRRMAEPRLPARLRCARAALLGGRDQLRARRPARLDALGIPCGRRGDRAPVLVARTGARHAPRRQARRARPHDDLAGTCGAASVGRRASDDDALEPLHPRRRARMDQCRGRGRPHRRGSRRARFHRETRDSPRRDRGRRHRRRRDRVRHLAAGRHIRGPARGRADRGCRRAMGGEPRADGP